MTQAIPNKRKIIYKATRTGARLHASSKRVRCIMGPIGSGKSVTCCWEIWRRACEQKKAPDGIRYSRWAVIRNTYPELKTTTLKTWLDWFPEEIFGKVRWDIPITHVIRINDVHLEVLFLALDRPQDAKKLLSLELTGVWFNEVREIEYSNVMAGDSRIWRYPSMRDGGSSWSGVIMDTNMPDDGHWLYTMAEEIRPETWDFFKQPGALIRVGPGEYLPNPEAENVGNHINGHGYWMDQVPGKSAEWIDVYILSKYSSVYDGKPVYPEYNDAIHSAAGNLLLYRGLPLFSGWDFGLNPSVVFMQISPRGQMRFVDELVADGMGLKQFLNDVVKPHIVNEYADMKIRGWGDPAGVARQDTDESTCFQVLQEAGFPIEPAPTNVFERRKGAIVDKMTRMVDGAPALLVSAKCRLLRRGFRGAYRYRRLQVPGEPRFSMEPEKTLVSHPHDAAQYVALGATYIPPAKQFAGPKKQHLPASRVGM